MRSAILFGASALLCAGISAQSVTLPSAAATVQGNYRDSYVLYGSATAGANQSHVQWIYETSDITIPVMLINSMNMRRPTTISNQNMATSWNIQIDMSVSPTSTPSTTFAGNHGPNQTTVFNGMVNFPTESNTSWPAPWLPPIPCSTMPFLYDGSQGNHFVVDFTTTNNSSMRTYYLESQQPNTGDRVTERSSCNFHDGTRNTGISYISPVVGGSWYCRYSSYPTNIPSFNASVQVIGLQGAGGMWGGMTLPIPLNSLSLPVLDPNCALANDVIVTTPAPYTDTGTSAYLTGATVPIPNDPSLANKDFYAQAISLDTATSTNMMGLHASWASKWTIGDGIPQKGATVYAIGSSAGNTTGNLRSGTVGTLQINP